MADLAVHHYEAGDGSKLAYRITGEGRPLVLIHGFTGDGPQMIDYGPAPALIAAGHQVILPDLRGHGASARPHDPAAYPPGALAADGLALVEHLGLDDYDLGGYSLGARVVVRMLVRGARPRRAVVAGQGLDAIKQASNRTGTYRRILEAVAAGQTLEPGSPEAEMARWLVRPGEDPAALALVLDTHAATTAAELAAVPTPTLVMVGDEDASHASAEALAGLLPQGTFTRLPGNHWSAMGAPELAAAMVAFLADR